MVRIGSLWIFLIFFSLTPVSGQIGKHVNLRSQNSIRQHADLYFERQAYSHAAKLYTKLVINNPEDTDVKLQLAECYRLLREPHSAAPWYHQAQIKGQLGPEHMFNYGSVLCATGDYRQAVTWFNRYLKARPGDKRAIAALKSLKNPHLLFDSRYQVAPLQIELPGAVFSPAIYDEGLVFVGEGGTGSLVKKVTAWIEGPYFDLYYVSLKDEQPGFPKYLDERLNSVFHEGPVSFFDGGNKVILTRSAFRKGQEDTRNLQLMIAERKPSGNWSSPKKLFHHQDYSIGHPAVDEQGKVIYFASNMPGGFGGSDIYRSDFKNGRWSKPVNMGPQVNTSGNELFPSIDAEGTLFFSSNGRGGLGGLEIFRFDLTESNIPVNMGHPINSPGDDFGLVWQPKSNRGYFSTNREGTDRIYRFEMENQLVNAAVPSN